MVAVPVVLNAGDGGGDGESLSNGGSGGSFSCKILRRAALLFREHRTAASIGAAAAFRNEYLGEGPSWSSRTAKQLPVVAKITMHHIQQP
jgi:hypothetical protein